jgi:hypothetical protein
VDWHPLLIYNFYFDNKNINNDIINNNSNNNKDSVYIDKIKLNFKKTKKIINWFMAIQAINDAGG